jgi:hypothetical protein
MKGEYLLALGAGIGIIYLVSMHMKGKTKAKIIHMPAPDVYDGDYIDPIRPAWPYNTAVVKPHADPYTGKLVSNHEPFPSQPMGKAEDFIISKIVQEFTAEGRLNPGMAKSLHERIKQDYMSDVKHIAMLNKWKLKSLHGRALSEYSTLVLSISHSHMLHLSASARARYEAQKLYVPEAHMLSVHRVGAALSDTNE